MRRLVFFGKAIGVSRKSGQAAALRSSIAEPCVMPNRNALAALGQPNSYATPRETRCSTSTSTSPATLSHHACKMGLEGIVSKRLGSRYRSGRSKDWLKMKNSNAPAVKTGRRVGLGSVPA
jgi:ATP-dependent DNA ligase